MDSLERYVDVNKKNHVCWYIYIDTTNIHFGSHTHTIDLNENLKKQMRKVFAV